MEDKILQIQNLVVGFNTENGLIRAVDNISFDLKKGEILGIVGESGCGKSVTALSIMRLLPKPYGFIENGKIIYKDQDIVKLPSNKMHNIRGKCISMIFQEPMTALNPVQKIGKQISEVFLLHNDNMSKKEAKTKSIEMLEKVQIPDPAKRINEYPHHLSGGMRQRVMIAMALACKPDILIADEPTTALDVTISAQILDLMKSLQQETNMAIIFITHDLGVVAEICDYVIVMYAGKIVEKASVWQLFKKPTHPYTKGLLDSIPKLENKRKIKLNTIKGRVPSLYNLPDGCRFYNRCNQSKPDCKILFPTEKAIDKNHNVSCFYV